ncbi:MAG: HEAT repeat domain-containing protein [Verrucomicrobia bacterium]|nr:HEAT repeat domain-containing protein [Verrucomicrobiota bacterium]
MVVPSVSPKVQALMSQAWGNSSFADGIAAVADRKENKESRALAMEVLLANRRRLNAAEMGQFLKEVTIIGKDTEEDEELSALGVRTLGNLALTMEESGQITASRAREEAGFLMEGATNTQRGVQFRASAITTLGVLKVTDASPLLRSLLADSQGMNVAEVGRPICLALMRVDGTGAVSSLRDVLRQTIDSQVFGTAAFALGQINGTESLVALVENLERFPDSAACDAALVNMEEVISRVLSNPQDTNLVYAIRGTQHLWREGQRERYVPLLRGLLGASPLQAQRAAIERLVESAGTLEFQKEKQELALILEAIKGRGELAEYEAGIRARLAAKTVPPADGKSAAVHTIRKEGK